MALKVIPSENKRSVILTIDDRFDFSLHQQFREAYVKCTEPNTTFTLNLSNASYMDSSALGMILLLKDHADRLQGKVVVINPNDTVYKILEIAQFHRLITIER